jgi:RNA polymerase sigma-70 factor, ECF subfamily
VSLNPNFSDSDSELIFQAQNGVKQAFGELALRYRKNICGLAFRMIGDLQEAEDITQNVFIRAYLALPKFTPNRDNSCKAWLLTITSRLCIDYIRRHKQNNIDMESMSHRELELIATAQNIRDTVIDAEERNRLCQALLRLPPNYRMAVALKYIEDLDYQEISRIMKIPLGTVGTWIRRGLAELKADIIQTELHPTILNQKRGEVGAKPATR